MANQENKKILHKSLIRDCEDNVKLTNWEFEFISSIKDRLSKPGLYLSDKQAEILERISERF